MIRKEKDGIAWLEFELLADFNQLQHGVFLRHGGVSTGSFASLNFSSLSGDNISHVETNREKVREIFQIPVWAKCRLEHGCRVVSVNFKNADDLHLCDAAATSERGIGLVVTHADCQAAIFYDPIQHVLANVHSGWRGNVQNIYAETVDFMKRNFLCSPENLLVCISPSLGPEDAEFINYRTEFPSEFWPFEVKPNYFNLWEISRWQLQQKGILPHHIQIAEINTYSNPNDYFSYRRSPISGRHGTIAALKH